jgi:hypothetical protein
VIYGLPLFDNKLVQNPPDSNNPMPTGGGGDGFCESINRNLWMIAKQYLFKIESRVPPTTDRSIQCVTSVKEDSTNAHGYINS